MAANTSFSQQALAADARFITRLQNGLTKVAFQVLQEPSSTAHHTERAAYANRVVNNPSQTAFGLAPSFVNRPNVLNFDTSYSFEALAVITAAGDADIESQLNSDWNLLAGVVGP